MTLSQCGQSAPSNGCMRVQLLSSFSISVDGMLVDLPAASQRLVAYLGIARHARERADIIDALWPHCSPTRGTSNLRSARWHLAKLSPMVRSVGRSRFTLDDDVTVDLHEVETYGWTLRDEANGNMSPPPIAITQQEELLPGWYDDWVITERERIKQLNMRFAQVLVERFVREVLLAEALDLALRLVDADPLCDGNQRSLLLALCAEGSNALAHNRLEYYRSQLAAFGLETALSLHCVMNDARLLVDSAAHQPQVLVPSPTFCGRPFVHCSS
jgi:DNA-binding SARP family transcriptional activator